MLYPSNIEVKLGFDKIRELIRNECISQLGRAYIDRISFSTDITLITKLQNQASEFQQIMLGEDPFPSQNFIDVTPHLEHIRIEGAVLDEEAIRDIRISLQAINQCLLFLKKRPSEECAELKVLAEPIQIDLNLLKDINKIIDESGKVKDGASKLLFDLRQELFDEKASLRKRMDTILKRTQADGFAPEDIAMTIRNGRMVLPVFAEYKRKIKGLIHDESATGQTVFIEPIEIFESNNRIKELENEERREVIRILASLTDMLRAHLPDLVKAYKFLGLMDFIRAKAKLAIKIDASRQQSTNETSLRWNNVFHPLLYLHHQEQGKPIVPLSLHLSQLQKILVISGPNAGGKSVVLKTIGLLQYMHQCGLLIPRGEQCTMGIYKDIFIDIGDEQSIDNDLSTYSSHLTNMREIIRNAGKNSLVLIDEFGTGTDPQYGGAIAEAILEELVTREVFAVINTHYSNLKYFAENTAGVVNGAMRFDYELLTPQYSLEIGQPGNSFALEIAQKIGLPAHVLLRCQSKIGDKRLNVDRLVKELSIEKESLRKKNEEIERNRKNLEVTVSQYQQLKSGIEANKSLLVHDAKMEARKILQDAKFITAKANKELKDAEKQDASKINAIRSEIQAYESKYLNSEPAVAKPSLSAKESQSIKKGDKVQVKDQDGVYKVLEVRKSEADLVLGELKTTVKLNRLTRFEGKHVEELPAFSKYHRGINMNERMANFSHTLDLRGKRGEEAMVLVERFIDDALLVAGTEIRILHGKGDGILRKLIREQLKRIPQIERFADEHIERGGDGITVIWLK